MLLQSLHIITALWNGEASMKRGVRRQVRTLLLAIPYAIGIIICVILAIVFKKKVYVDKENANS